MSRFENLHNEHPLLDSPPAIGRRIGGFVTTRVLVAAFILGALTLLGMYAGFFSPVEPEASVGGQISITIFLTVLTMLSCWYPAIGPRYGAAVPLTPLVGLLSAMLLPPWIAALPIALVGGSIVWTQQEPTRRLAYLDRFLLIIAAQIAASIVARALPVTQDRGPFDLSNTEFLCVGGVMAVVYGGFFVGGSYLASLHRARERGTLSNVAAARELGVYSFNEAVIFTIGGPLAILLGLLFYRTSALAAATVLLLTAAPLIIVARALVDGNMVRRQLHAMERLTKQAAIGQSLSTERYLTDFLEYCRKVLIYDRAIVWLYNEQELVLEKCVEYNGGIVSFQPSMRRVGEDLVGRVAERRKAMLVDDVRRDARHRYFQLSPDEKRAMGPVSVMLIPCTAGGSLVGVIEFERRELAAYGRADRERLQSLAGLVAMTLANNRLHQEVVQQAVTDGLTGLYNKRQILKTLSDEAARAQRYAHTLSVMMLDLDGFKKFNDTFGHMQGDVLLQSLSELITQSIRGSDIAGRYGGEEFIVVMPETGREAAWITAERIRARVEAEEFLATVNYETTIGLAEATEDCQPHTVVVQKTISIGIATFPVDALDHKTLLERADEALYIAKNTGRNRVVMASYPNENQPQTLINASDSVSNN